MTKISVLLTGFNPFAGETVNPAWEAVRALTEKSTAEGVKIVGVQLPTAFQKSLADLEAAIVKYRPQVVVCVGQAGGRFGITLERVAINVNDARIADNEGQQPLDTPVVQGGPVAYWTGLPIKKIVAALQQAGLPASVSNSAGTYVCNHLFYGLMHLLDTRYPGVIGGFVHIPYLPKQVTEGNQPSMALADVVSGLEVMLGVVMERG
ncbi:pyroglutamyl-peptidase I [Alicyclobacillaceae bacterium I2511]|nr:pyroglutamyl-peptidase I [Alicyclobacillaceae bacterium I2511]